MINSEQVKIKIKDIERQMEIASKLIQTLNDNTPEGKQSKEYWNQEIANLKIKLSELIKELFNALEQEAKDQKENAK